MLKLIFSWWNGATIGIHNTIARRGVLVGKDDYGNTYYEARDNKDSYDGRKRRWVTYTGYAEASKVPPEWHGWLHHTVNAPLETPKQSWIKPHQSNMTGTDKAYLPPGHDQRGGERAKATGDYQAWTPDS